MILLLNKGFNKAFKYLAIKLVLLFLLIASLYYFFNIRKTFFEPKLFVALAFGILAGITIHTYKEKKLTKEKMICYIIALGLILRIGYAMYNNVFSRQHDVGDSWGTGHYGYVLTIFRTGELPLTNESQYYQAPLHHIISAYFMKFAQLFIDPANNDVKQLFNTTIMNKNYDVGKIYGLRDTGNYPQLIQYVNALYNTTRILTAYYSCLTFIIIYYILKELKLKEQILIPTLLVMAVQPVMVMLAGAVNNDCLSYFFFFLSLLLALKWFNKPKMLMIVFMAISIGLGMLTKISTGFVAVIIAPLMAYRLLEAFRENPKQTYKLMCQFVCFAVIVIPLGLCFAVRNNMIFDQPFNYVLDFPRRPDVTIYIGEHSVGDRIAFLPNRFFKNIYHDWEEYNIWVDLMKTSSYGEWGYDQATAALPLYLTNMFLALFAIICIIYIIVIIIKDLIQKNKTTLLPIIALCFGIISLFMFTYIKFAFDYPFSCTTNFRYVVPLAFAGALLMAVATSKSKNVYFRNTYYILATLLAFFSSMFIIVI